jgi:hypothetical protein
VGWDCFVLLLVAYSCAYEPYKAVFLSVQPAPLDWVIDACYVVDILLHFSTGFVVDGGVEVLLTLSNLASNPYLPLFFTILGGAGYTANTERTSHRLTSAAVPSAATTRAAGWSLVLPVEGVWSFVLTLSFLYGELL